MKAKHDENADWEKTFDLIAHESDPQVLGKYLDRLIQALNGRKKEELRNAAARETNAPQSVEEEEKSA